MKGYLLDTDVISMLSPSKPEVSPLFLEWLERTDGDGQVFLSVVTVHEIEKGITRLERRGADAKAAGLKTWLTGLLTTFGDKILDLDSGAASLSGRLEGQAVADGHDPGMADAMIAGIATVRDLTVVTRNARHFGTFGITVLSPDDIGAGMA